MYDTQTRMYLLKDRVISRQKALHSALIFKLSVLSCCVLLINISIISYFSDASTLQSNDNWFYGSTMLSSNAGGYVLVAIISFVIAVIFTVFCMHKQNKVTLFKKDDED